MPSVRALKEVFKAAVNCATIKYPYGPPAHLPEGFRGKLQIDSEKCIACGACAMVCASGANKTVEEDGKVGVKVQFTRCIFCGQCQDTCPTEALKLTTEFALTTDKPEELELVNESPLAKCQNCGAPVASAAQLEWGLQRVLQNIDPSIRSVVEEDAKKYLKLCIGCRERQSLKLNIHTKKYV